MMKKIIYISLILLSPTIIFGQRNSEVTPTAFEQIIKHFTETIGWNLMSGQINNSVSTQNLFETDEFKLSISANPIDFKTSHKVLTNPYFTDDFDDYDDNYINYPTSYSVIYDHNLISLFRNGEFICHSLKGFHRNEDLESKLNTKKFKYHWIIDGKLGALSGNSVFLYDEGNWVRHNKKYPLLKQSKLFEDEDFIVFNDCHGEWGGIVYFYDKTSKDIHLTESTCANTVFKDRNSYLVVSHLGHMMGSSAIKEIKDPRLLDKANKTFIKKRGRGKILNFHDDSDSYSYRFNAYEILLFSSFEFNGRQLYIGHLNELTFLLELKNQSLEIVSPLFNDGFYTHDPITTSYEPYTLINIDHYGTAKDKEISVIVLDGNKITRLDWNENHSR